VVECWGSRGVFLWPRFHAEMGEGSGGSPGGLNQSGERKEREWGPDSAQPSGGKKGGGRCRSRLSEGRDPTPAVTGPSASQRRSGRQGSAHVGGGLVWLLGRPGKRKESGPEKEMGPTPEE
jgi:hypothetical protein